MSNFENDANLATENATSNIDIQCLGDSNMDSSCHNKLDTLKDNGQPLLDGSGQNVGGSINGQNGKDSSEATDGSSNGQHGIDSSKAAGEAHTNAPNTHEATARDHGHKGKSKQTYASFFESIGLCAETDEKLLEEIRGHCTSAYNIVLDHDLPGLAELKGCWRGSLDASGGGNGDTKTEFDFHGEEWEWGTYTTQQIFSC